MHVGCGARSAERHDMVELVGAIATVLAVSGVLLNNRLNIWCFALWGVSNSLSAGLHVHAELWSLMVRDVIFLALAAEGAWRWRAKRLQNNDTDAATSHDLPSNDRQGQ